MKLLSSLLIEWNPNFSLRKPPTTPFCYQNDAVFLVFIVIVVVFIRQVIPQLVLLFLHLTISFSIIFISTFIFFIVIFTSDNNVDFCFSEMEQAVLDDIINRLLEVRSRPGKQVQLSEAEIRQLCAAAREIFLQQPNLLELEAPIKICGKFSSFL